MLSILLHQVRRILLIALLGGLLGATLVRMGPGFGIGEREMDNRTNDESRQAIRSERAQENNIGVFYFRYLSGLAHGDFGFSRSLNRPVSQLLKERLPLTLVSLAYGVLGGASMGLMLALLTMWWHAPGSEVVPAVLSGVCPAVPPADMALLFLWICARRPVALSFVAFPPS